MVEQNKSVAFKDEVELKDEIIPLTFTYMHPKILGVYGFIKSGIAFIDFSSEGEFEMLADELLVEWDSSIQAHHSKTVTAYCESHPNGIKRLLLSNNQLLNVSTPMPPNPSRVVCDFNFIVGVI